MADSTSRAAASMLRLRSNWSVMLVPPRELEEVISVTAAMRPNCRSSGVATEDAMMEGLPPGSDAETEMVGKSTWGSGDTGSRRKATAPAKPTAIVSSAVATGRLMKGAERLTASLHSRGQDAFRSLFSCPNGAGGKRQIWRRARQRKDR